MKIIRVGINKPKLKYIPEYYDMGRYFPPRWEVNNYFLMELYDYIEKRRFNYFDYRPINLNKKQMKKIFDDAISGKKVTYFESLSNPASSHLYNLQKMIEMAGGCAYWEFDAIHPNKKDYVRQIIGIGERDIVCWNWVDIYIKLPFMKTMANILNSLNWRKK